MKVSVLWDQGKAAEDNATTPLLPWGLCLYRGGVAVADCNRHQVCWLGPDGAFQVIAGTELSGCSGDRGPAAEAQLSGPCGVAAGPDGSLFIADTFNHQVRQVTSDGIIHTVAGSGAAYVGDPRDMGDGGSAPQACLSEPYGVAVTPEGRLLIADSGNNRVRFVDAEGIIRTVAGSGPGNLTRPLSRGMLLPIERGGYAGDGGPAAEARLNRPTTVALAGDGSLLIADQNNNCIRQVDRGGTITTVAGIGKPGCSGPEGPALEARLDSPFGVAADPQGGFLIADTSNGRVCRVSEHGILRTVVGGDGELNGPSGVVVSPEDALLIVDAVDARVLRVTGWRPPRQDA